MTLAAQAALRATAEPTIEALVENLTWMRAHGVHPEDAAARVGYSRPTLSRRMNRARHLDLASYIDTEKGTP